MTRNLSLMPSVLLILVAAVFILSIPGASAALEPNGLIVNVLDARIDSTDISDGEFIFSCEVDTITNSVEPYWETNVLSFGGFTHYSQTGRGTHLANFLITIDPDFEGEIDMTCFLNGARPDTDLATNLGSNYPGETIVEETFTFGRGSQMGVIASILDVRVDNLDISDGEIIVMCEADAISNSLEPQLYSSDFSFYEFSHYSQTNEGTYIAHFVFGVDPEFSGEQEIGCILNGARPDTDLDPNLLDYGVTTVLFKDFLFPENPNGLVVNILDVDVDSSDVSDGEIEVMCEVDMITNSVEPQIYSDDFNFVRFLYYSQTNEGSHVAHFLYTVDPEFEGEQEIGCILNGARPDTDLATNLNPYPGETILFKTFSLGDEEGLTPGSKRSGYRTVELDQHSADDIAFLGLGWECGMWSACTEGIQTRQCQNVYDPQALMGSPVEVQSCSADLTFAETKYQSREKVNEGSMSLYYLAAGILIFLILLMILLMILLR